MLAQRVQRGKTFRLRVGQRRREEVERRHSGDQRRPGAAEREKENRRDGNVGSVLGREIRRDAAEPGRKPEQRSSRAMLRGRLRQPRRRHPRPRPDEGKTGTTDGNRGNASNDAAVGEATWATISGETSLRKENRARTTGSAERPARQRARRFRRLQSLNFGKPAFAAPHGNAFKKQPARFPPRAHARDDRNA